MSIEVLVVGAGMYVCGRGTHEYGTVLPTLCEAYRKRLINNVYVASTTQKSIKSLKGKARKLNQIMGIDMHIEGFPRERVNMQAYKTAIRRLKPDCAIVVVPDHLHCRIASDLIKAGIHTLVVKPLAPTTREAKMLIELLKKNKVYGAVEFHKRFDETNLKLRDVIKSGQLGELLYITVEYSQKKIIPEKLFRKWAEKTNIFQYLGVHYADIIYFVTGAKPLRVLATGQKKWLIAKGIDTYDSVQALIEWIEPVRKRTFISTILTNWIDPDATSAMSDQKIKVIGTLGRYDNDQKNRGVQIVTDKNGIEDFNPYFSQFYTAVEGKKVFQGYGERSVHQFLEDVSSIIYGDKKPADFTGERPSFEDALVSTAIIEAVNKSLQKNNSWVSVKQV